MRRIFALLTSWGIGFASAYAAGEIPPPPALGSAELLRVSGSLIIVLIVIALSAWLVRKFIPGGGIGGAGPLRVVGGVSLGGRERAVLMQVGAQQILVGVAPGWVRTLHVLEQPLALPPTAATPRAVVRETPP